MSHATNFKLRFSLAGMLVVVTGLCLFLALAVPRTNQLCLEQTNHQLDLAIVGKGYFQVAAPSGETYYTRCGELELNADGELVLRNQLFRIEPNMSVPLEATTLIVTSTGEVQCLTPGDSTLFSVGCFLLATFQAPQHLKEQGRGLYSATAESGAPMAVCPGDTGSGYLMQGWRESTPPQPQYLFLLIPAAIVCGIAAARVVR